MQLIFPTKNRRTSLKIAGGFYVFLSVVLYIISISFDLFILIYPAGLFCLVGLFVLGYHRTVSFDSEQKLIHWCKGFYFIRIKKQEKFNTVETIELQKVTSLQSEFSNVNDDIYRSSLKTTNNVSIIFKDGQKWLVDGTSNSQDAESWASEIASLLKTSFVQNESKDEKPNQWKNKITLFITVLVAIGALYLVYMILSNVL